jgi:DNA-3-methyladenine glycosylase I
MADYDDARQAQLLTDRRIIRNRAKVRAFRENALATLRLQDEGSGLDAHLWGFVDGRPIVHHFTSTREIPAETPLATTISKDLKRRGFCFVGPVIVYALMQSVGLVNDHLVSCFRHAEV